MSIVSPGQQAQLASMAFEKSPNVPIRCKVIALFILMTQRLSYFKYALSQWIQVYL